MRPHQDVLEEDASRCPADPSRRTLVVAGEKTPPRRAAGSSSSPQANARSRAYVRLVDDAHERLAVDLGGGEGIVSSNDGQDRAHAALSSARRACVDDEAVARDDESAAAASRRPGPGGAVISASSSAAGGASGWWSRESRSRRARSLSAAAGLRVSARSERQRVGGRRFAAAATEATAAWSTAEQLSWSTAARPRPALRRASPRARPHAARSMSRRRLAVVSGEYGGAARERGVRGGTRRGARGARGAPSLDEAPPPRQRGSAVARGFGRGLALAHARAASRRACRRPSRAGASPCRRRREGGARGRSADADEGGGDSLGNPRVGPSEESQRKGASPARLVPHFAPRLHERRRPRDASATPSATVIRDRYRSR